MANLSQEIGLIVASTFFLLLVAVGIVALVLVYRRKQAEYIHEQKEMKTAFEKELLEAQLQMQEQTLKNVAQEIHDNIGGTLSLAKLHLNSIHPDRQAVATEKISASAELVTKAITELRGLSKSLHPEAVLSAGLTKAIETELKLIQKTALFQTAFTVEGEPLAVDAQKELILFRTVQEALNNAIKHSGASLIQVMLHYHPQGLQLTVQDNGKGFNTEAEEKSPDRGSGLRNMQARTKLIGGTLVMESANPGSKISVSLPIIAA